MDIAWIWQKETLMNVQYEEMFPHEFEAALAKFPVAYVPVGSLEWHGRHLPYGNDALKAHGILVRTAHKYGGVVVPPTYWAPVWRYTVPAPAIASPPSGE